MAPEEEEVVKNLLAKKMVALVVEEVLILQLLHQGEAVILEVEDLKDVLIDLIGQIDPAEHLAREVLEVIETLADLEEDVKKVNNTNHNQTHIEICEFFI